MNIRAISIRRVINSGLLVGGILFTVSCTDSGGFDGIQIAEGGISGTGISSGSITGFSSVILNGRTLEVTSQTEIYVDEQLSNVSALQVGQVVRVDVDFENSTADRIDYVETVLGPLASAPEFNVDTLAGSLDILGQTVLTNSVTVFDGALDVSALTTGNVIEVSGVRNADDSIVARYISLKSTPIDTYRVLGKVDNLTSSSFTIGGLTVDMSSADIGDFGIAGIQQGDEVRVKAEPSGFAGGTLTASKITPSSLKVALTAGDDLELEGVITDFQSLSSMMINGLIVNAANASIENGAAEDIGRDRLVEVEGSVDDSEILQATKIKVIPLSNIRIEAPVDSVDMMNRSIEVLGLQFFLDDKTQLDDNSSLKISEFSLSDLNEGDRVEIRAFSLDEKRVLTRLERDDPDPDMLVRILGPVDEVDQMNHTVTILGVVLSTDINDTDFENINNEPIQQADFFGSVQPGDLVRAKWKNFTNLTQPLDEISIED